MKRRRTFLIIFVILILVLAVGVGALLLMRGGGPGPQPPSEVAETTPTPETRTQKVVVAVQTIPRGMRIPPDAVALFDWPEEDLPEDPIDKLEDVIGMVARVEIPRERPISASQVKVVFWEKAPSSRLPSGRAGWRSPYLSPHSLQWVTRCVQETAWTCWFRFPSSR